MFVFNLKLTRKLIFKILFIIIFICALFIAGIAIYKVFNYESVNDSIPIPEIIDISSDNYTNVLKTVHENLDEYVRTEN